MALPLRPRLIPQCPACLRSYVFSSLLEVQGTSLRQQVRGRKKMPNHSSSITVRLLKDVEAYGRRGSLVPISPGAMRNAWYPTGVAEYVTLPEMKPLRLTNAPMERDPEFAIPKPEKLKSHRPMRRDRSPEARTSRANAGLGDITTNSIRPSRAPEVELLSPHRSIELLDSIIPPRLDFYRQPILPAPTTPTPEKQTAAPRFSGAAGDLLAARMGRNAIPAGPLAIYGSVSVQDVLVAMRAVMAADEEAARVVLQESDIAFVDLPDLEGADSARVKHVGDFEVEVKVRGAEEMAVRRMVRVIPQDASGGSEEAS